MRLMTKALAKRIPALYGQAEKGDDAIVYAHWFSTNWDWYCTEYDPERGLCFGLAKKGQYAELGYWTVAQLEGVNRREGFQVIERDLYWNECKIADVK